MNDRISQATLNTLIELTQEPVVSLFMPTHAVTVQGEQDPIRLRNLLDTVEERLQADGYDGRTVKSLLKSARALLDDRQFWLHQSQGLALYLTTDSAHVLRVPLALEPAVFIGRHAHLIPILPLLSNDGRFYVLALSQNEVRLLEGTRDRVQEVALDDVPRSLADALRYDEFESQLQYHTGTGSATHGHGRAAFFHGHGVGTDDSKTSILRFFQQIDDGLQAILADQRSPLVLAGVDYLHAIYRKANHYAYLVDDGIHGNPEHLSPEELHAEAWSLVEPLFLQDRQAAVAQLQQELGSDGAAPGKASQRVHEVVRAGQSGRVATVFVAVDRQVWGTFNPESYTVTIHDSTATTGADAPPPATEDLLNLIALQTIAGGGTVYALPRAEMPVDSDVAALFRYAIEPEEQVEQAPIIRN